MGYWGLALSLLGDPLAGPPAPLALRQGESLLLPAKPVGVRTERKYDYLQAVSVFIKTLRPSLTARGRWPIRKL